MEQDAVLSKVRKMLERAEHPGTPVEEAEECRRKANQWMVDYAIEQADLDASRPADQRSVPESIRLDLIRANSPVRWDIIRIAGFIADHCRCKIAVHNYFEEVADSSYMRHFQVAVTAVGYAPDLRYFEMLLTIVQLHFSGAVDPRPDDSLSFDANVYRMHEAGVTYRKMVSMLFPGEMGNWTTEQDIRRLGGRCKSAYRRECKKRGEDPHAIPNPDVYQRSFAKAYAETIWLRLYRMQGSSSGGRTTALVRRMTTIDEKFDELFPPNQMAVTSAPEDVKADAAGMFAGQQAASEVDLAGQRVGGSANRREIG